MTVRRVKMNPIAFDAESGNKSFHAGSFAVRHRNTFAQTRAELCFALNDRFTHGGFVRQISGSVQNIDQFVNDLLLGLTFQIKTDGGRRQKF